MFHVPHTHIEDLSYHHWAHVYASPNVPQVNSDVLYMFHEASVYKLLLWVCCWLTMQYNFNLVKSEMRQWNSLSFLPKKTKEKKRKKQFLCSYLFSWHNFKQGHSVLSKLNIKYKWNAFKPLLKVVYLV